MLSEAILLLCPAGIVQACNPAFCELFGYEPDEIIGKMLITLAAVGSQEMLSESLHTFTQTQQPQRLQLAVQSHKGCIFDVDVTLVVAEDGATVCSMRDISEMKNAQRAKDAFISMVSHELKNPITNIAASAETLLRYYDRLPDTNRQQKILCIHQQATNLADLINAILEISRLDSHRALPTAAVMLNVIQTLRYVAAEMQPAAAANSQQITLVLPEAALPDWNTGVDLIRVLKQLIGNAIKYAGSGSTITVRINPPRPALEHIPDDALLMQVADNGRGIPCEDQAKLFSRFFRGWAAQTSIPGTGLGLAYVRDLLRVNGGDIVLDSDAHAGTSFYFWMPVILTPS